MPYKRAVVKEKYRPRAEKLVDQIREVMRYHHYSIRTETSYVNWIVRCGYSKGAGVSRAC